MAADRAENRSLDQKIMIDALGSVAPVRHPDELTLESLSAAISTGVSKASASGIPVRRARRAATSAPP